MMTARRLLAMAALAFAVVVPNSAWAQDATPDLTTGEIRKVDKDTKKLTIRHAEIKNLDMPGMTMLFRVKDPAMLEKVKAGDKVKFRAEMVDGAIVVTEIQVAP